MNGISRRKPIIIAGPTASGKSLLALRLAGEIGGIIVNADSMQVYDAVPTITSRPTSAATESVPHKLYGIVNPAEEWSTGKWLANVKEVLSGATENEQTPIIVGGTGLYLFALTEEFAEIPPISPSIRAEIRAETNIQKLWNRLMEQDPQAKSHISSTDYARISRALEVILSTGRTLKEWHAVATSPLLPKTQAQCLHISPNRHELHLRINRRVDSMMDKGALKEVEALMDLNLPERYGIMKAIGIRPLMAFLRGELSLEAGIEMAKTETKRYAKRQETWFRNKMSNWKKIDNLEKITLDRD